eukprot:Skav230211  [mRNA]  locus=scaffold1765:84503:89062:- [translate_table: standard]
MTCRESTCNDQSIIHPDLVEYLTGIHVDKSKFLHDHDPVIRTWQLPVNPPVKYVWRMPASWTAYEPSPDIIEEKFKSLPEAAGWLNLDNHNPSAPVEHVALEKWSSACERAVNAAIRSQHLAQPDRFPVKQLPRNTYGRCKKRKLVRVTSNLAIPHACDGQFNPVAETTSYHIAHWIKQTRRVQSLRNIRQKQNQHALPTQQMRDEWSAILKSKGFQSFQTWCANQPELNFCPRECPDVDYLHTLAQLLQYHTQAKLAAEQQHRSQLARYHKFYDQHNNSLKDTIRGIKGNPHPSLTTVTFSITAEATILDQDHGHVELLLGDSTHFRPGQQAHLDSHECTILHQDGSKLAAMLTDADIHQHCPTPNEVQKVHVARELGYTVNYNKVHSRSTQSERHQQAMQYIKKSRQNHLTLDSRAKLCSYAVVKALWGTESYVVGQSWFVALRSAIAKTLVIDKPHSNARVACMLLSRFIEDPELYHLKQCIRSVRNMLNFQSPTYQESFLRFAARHNRRHTSVWGPAGALAFNLAKVGWGICKNGMLDTDTRLELHLLHTPLKCLFRQLEHAWLKHMVQCDLQRPEWTQLPVPNRAATLKCIRSLPLQQQHSAAVAITGASMLAQQVSHVPAARDTYHTDQCALCGAPDSYMHRNLECTSTAHVRARHEDVVQDMMDIHECHVNLPVVFDVTDHDFNQWYFYTRPPPVMTDSMTQAVSSELQRKGSIVCYTDGSCDHPHQPSQRRAAFAVILECTHDDINKTLLIDRFAVTGDIPDAFQVLMLGEVVGTQNVPRAELQAALAVARLRCPAHVWTDSSYVLTLIHDLTLATDVRIFHARANYDLIRELWSLVRRPDFTVGKVKAHSLDISKDDLDTTWTKLGNEAADRAAKQYLRHLHSVTPLTFNVEDATHAVARCTQWHHYLYDLTVERAKLFQSRDVAEPLGDADYTWDDMFLLMQHWTPDPSRNFPYPIDAERFLPFCVWGSQYSDLLLQWLATLHWPTDEAAYDPVSWYELATSFLYCSQYGIVVNSGHQHADFVPTVVKPNHPDVPWGVQVRAFEKAICNLQKWSATELLPWNRQLSKGHRVLGGTHSKHGLAGRPQYPYQEQVCQNQHEHLKLLQLRPDLSGGPVIPDLQPNLHLNHFSIDAEDELRGWHVRVNRARKAR